MTGLVFAGANWDGVPDKLKFLVYDCDGEKTSASQFFAWHFYNSLISGVHCCYINSNKPEGAGGLATDDERNGYRVRFSDVPGGNILGGAYNTVRLSATQQESDGGYGWKEIEKVYVLSPEEIEIWKRREGDSEFVRAEGYPIRNTTEELTASFLILGERLGRYHGIPVLDDLAGIQLEHLRTTSLDAQYREGCNWLWVHSNGYDLTGGVHSPLTVWAAGQESTDAIDPTAKKWIPYEGQHPPFIKITEATGNVAKYNKERLEEAKANAALWGMAQLRPDGVTFSTATSWNLTQKATTSSLSLWAEICENYIFSCFRTAGKMVGIEVTEKPCLLEKDYSSVQLDQLAAYINLNANGIISKETVFNTVKKTGGIETSNDWAKEQEAVTDEGIVTDGTTILPGFDKITSL